MKNIWVPLSGALAQQRNVETIANNVANANTPGFKRDQLTFKEYLTILQKGSPDINLPKKEWGPEDFYRSYGSENAQVVVDGSYTIHQQGQLTPTGNSLDLAINGPGFFEVLSPNGIRYTRRGTFSLTKNGTIVTAQGYPVLSKINIVNAEEQEENIPAPDARKIQVEPGQVNINLKGEILNNLNPIGNLSIVEFKDVNALKKEGSTLFINSHQENISNQENSSSVHQGFIEESNVNAVSEMSSLIKANRHFESIQRAIKAYDHITGRAVNDISKF